MSSDNKPSRPLDALRDNIAKSRERSQAAKEDEYEFNVTAACLIGDLRYPVSKDGSVMDLTYYAPLIAWHLARAGWRCDQSKRKIKPRKIIAKGVSEGAIEWVLTDAPDDPLANLNNMTMAEVNALPPVWHAEAVRRMGGPELPDLPDRPEGWHPAVNMTIVDEPDPDDGYQWTGRKFGGQT